MSSTQHSAAQTAQCPNGLTILPALQVESSILLGFCLLSFGIADNPTPRLGIMFAGIHTTVHFPSLSLVTNVTQKKEDNVLHFGHLCRYYRQPCALKDNAGGLSTGIFPCLSLCSCPSLFLKGQFDKVERTWHLVPQTCYKVTEQSSFCCSVANFPNLLHMNL